MTTVIWDGKTLASDSQMTKGRGMITLGEFPKIYEPDPEKEYWEVNGKKVVAFGLGGDAKAVAYIRDTLHKGINYRTQIDVDDELLFQAILVCEDHSIFEWTIDTNKEKRNTWSELVEVLGPTAAGSGGRFALAVVAVGKNSHTAVKAAIRLDPYSGGTIREFTPPPAPEVPSVRPEHLKPKEEPKASEGEEKPAEKGKGKPAAKAA